MQSIIKAKLGYNLYPYNYLSNFQVSCDIAKNIMARLLQEAQPDNTTEELNRLATSLIKESNSFPLFEFNYFPAAICVSNNADIVHGLPNNHKLVNGDILSIDLGVEHKGWCADFARTVSVGGLDKASIEDQVLIKTAEEAFDQALKVAYPGNTTGDIGFAIHKRVLQARQENKYVFRIFMEFQGHGIGKELHEPPYIPNIGIKGKGIVLQEGMCICIEPVVLYKTSNVIKYLINDTIQFKSSDGRASAHYENQVYISKRGPIVLTR